MGNIAEKAKVLLFHPDIKRSNIVAADMFPALGINILGTILKLNRIPVVIIDPFKSELLLEYEGHTVFSHIKNILANSEITVVGISVNIETIRISIQVIRFVKSFDPSIKIVLGGPCTTFLYRQFYKYYGELIDYIILGEGEKTFLDLCKAILANAPVEYIDGLSYKKDHYGLNIRTNVKKSLIGDLDSIPFPDYSHYFQNKFIRKFSSACILMNRGCVYDCAFCSSKSLWGKMRSRSSANIADEIQYLKQEYGISNLHFHDDTFGSNYEQTVEVLERIVNFNYPISIYCHSHFTVLDERLISV